MTKNQKKALRHILIGSTALIVTVASLYFLLPQEEQPTSPKQQTQTIRPFSKKAIPTFPDTIKGEVITLKKMTLASAFDYFTMFSVNVRKGLEFPEKITFGYVSQMVTNVVTKMEKGLVIAYNIWDNAANKMVGSIKIKEEKDPYYGQLSMWINENFRGGGRIQEALLLISKAYFKARPSAKSYSAHARLWNKASFNALKKFGFKKVNEYIENGKPTIHIMELTRDAIKAK